MDATRRSYQDLPETVPASDLYNYFTDVLRQAENGADPSATLAAFTALSERQWRTYERLDAALALRIEAWISRHITHTLSLEGAEDVVSMTAQLGLSGALQHLSALAGTADSPAVRNELLEAAAELQDTIDQPYAGLTS